MAAPSSSSLHGSPDRPAKRPNLSHRLIGVACAVLLAALAADLVSDSSLAAGIAALLSVLAMFASLRSPAADAPRWAEEAGQQPRLSRLLMVEAGLCLFVMLVAAVPRLVELGDIPPGFHGDEAVAGIEARRIRGEGLIGPYSLEASGLPAGTFYWTAVVTAVGGESIFTVRLSYALIGIATIGILYIATRFAFDRPTALVAGFLLAVSAWHVHYSRVAFIPLGAPFFVVLTLACFAAALKYRKLSWFGLTGLALGAGVYTYPGYVAFLPGFVIASVLVLFVAFRAEWRRLATGLCLLFLAAVIAALPMMKFAFEHENVVFGRFRDYSVFNRAEYQSQDGPLARADYLLDRGVSFIEEVLVQPRMDGVEGAGLYRLVDPVTTLLIILGVGVALARIRTPVHLCLLVLSLVLLSGPVFSIEGEYRRALSVTPLLAMLAALPLGLALALSRLYSRSIQGFVAAAALLLLTMVAINNLEPYFRTYDDHSGLRVVYGAEFLPAFEAIGRLPDKVEVLLYSDRVSYDHPTRRFLAPNNPGEDRSHTFGAGFNLETDRGRDTVFVFLERYVEYVDTVTDLYPGGVLSRGPTFDNRTAYVAYFLPRAKEAREPSGTR
jgi:4-amino-4-deoxy-L-arabinose transferase-like glycosyltransferase